MRTLITVAIAIIAAVLLYTNLIKPLEDLIKQRITTINRAIDTVH